MKLIKRSERVEKSGKDLIWCVKNMGGNVKYLNRYSKWIEVFAGSLCDTMDLYELELCDGKRGWILVDALKRLACNVQIDKNEILNWLKEHEWKMESPIDDDDDEEDK